MEERYVKLEALVHNEEEAVRLFSGSAEETRARLAENGIEFTEEEFADFLAGMKSSLMAENDELNEESLEDVAGGCSTCYNDGKKFGKKVGKILKPIVSLVKWIFS